MKFELEFDQVLFGVKYDEGEDICQIYIDETKEGGQKATFGLSDYEIDFLTQNLLLIYQEIKKVSKE